MSAKTICRVLSYLAISLAVFPPPVYAASKESDQKEEETASKHDPFLSAASKAPWRGSQVVFSNSFSLISLDRSAELTYNPNYSMVWSFRPRWWFGDNFFLRAVLDVTRELTEADETTYSGEAWLGDLSLSAGAAKLWTIPVVGIDVSGDVALTFPTSKASQAKTLVMAVGPRLRLSRNFNVLKGLILGANLRATPYFHRYTTSERSSPLIGNCQATEAGCGAFLNMGTRNQYFRLATSLDATLVVFDWMGASVSYGWLIDWLHDASGGEGEISYVPQEPQNQRYYSFFEIDLFFDPFEFLEVGVTLLTYAPQLAPDSSYYNPFFNRYSTVSVDLIFRVDGLVALLGGA
ncbi:MAG: hypothetical protein D6806_05935 [Deltaproteobacteria bacterium]|nr:MAG: hypothetical protein D6806_05935 [Deltaproteobacteria bacterium]